jgi:outer membrane cobalamin receptor
MPEGSARKTPKDCIMPTCVPPSAGIGAVASLGLLANTVSTLRSITGLALAALLVSGVATAQTPSSRTVGVAITPSVERPAAVRSAGDPSAQAVVEGVVTDPDGARVPGAAVVLSSQLAATITAQADGTGAFRVTSVAPGHYELRVSADGFRADPVGVVVTAGQRIVVPVRLHVSAVTESVVVSAAQVEQPLTRAADSISTIGAAELRTFQTETVGDALRIVPGMGVAQSGGRGALTSVFPRGGESNFTLVLVDGIKANAFGGGFDFAGLTTANVERVEVVRGPESALFGADAIGGVVQVVTRHGGRPGVDALLETGSFGTTRGSLGASGSAGAWSWGGSAERTASDGYTGVAPATGELVSNDDWLESHASASGSWRGTRGTDIRGTFNVTKTDRGYPGPYGSNPIGAYTSVDRVSRGMVTSSQYGVRWLQPYSVNSQRFRQTTTASYLDVTSDYTSAYGLSAAASTRFGARTQIDASLASRMSVSAGAEYQREQATSTYITAEAYEPVPIRRHIAAGFAEARLEPTSALSVTAGVRVERVERDALGSSPDPYSPRPAFGADIQTAVNPRVSLAWFLSGSENGRTRNWTRVHASAGTGMRAPDAFEIAFTDNPGLKPERSRSVEAGADQALLGERLVVGATAFYNRYDDLIVSIGPALHDASHYRTDNISNARVQGAEVFASSRSRWGLTARFAYTFLDSEILAVDSMGTAPPPFSVGDPLIRRPRHSASVDVAYARGRLSAFGRLTGRGTSLDVEPSYDTYGGLYQNPGHVAVDAGASFKVVKAVTVTARVANLMNRSYEETYGYPAPGRNFMIGVRVAAGR